MSEVQQLKDLIGDEVFERLRRVYKGLEGPVVSGGDSMPGPAVNRPESIASVEAGKSGSVASCESSGGSVGSWADEMNEVDAGAVVEGVPAYGEGVKRIVFGGFGDVQRSDRVSGASDVSSGGGLMASYLRAEGPREYRRLLRGMGVKLPKSAAYDLALVTHTAATMPEFFRRGKARLRTLAVLGDAALVGAVTADALESGSDVESLQGLRSSALSDAVFMAKFASSPYAKYLTVGTGIKLASAKTSATALEALFGVVAYYNAPGDVRRLARALGVL